MNSSLKDLILETDNFGKFFPYQIAICCTHIHIYVVHNNIENVPYLRVQFSAVCWLAGWLALKVSGTPHITWVKCCSHLQIIKV